LFILFSCLKIQKKTITLGRFINLFIN